MQEIILIVLMVCGQADTYIVKEPSKAATYTHDVSSEKTTTTILDVLKTKPTVIVYEEDRGKCA